MPHHSLTGRSVGMFLPTGPSLVSPPHSLSLSPVNVELGGDADARLAGSGAFFQYVSERIVWSIREIDSAMTLFVRRS